ncbi:MAG: cupin domain-containing protein [Candidatus Omnitrophica bacterium]|nr:cupin domain-containing protein [Candidatus Omnitrophota bacterium]
MSSKSFIGREKGKPFVARDGALIFELFRDTGLDIKNMSIASGYLEPGQKAIPHFHKVSEEIYYVLASEGICRIGNIVEAIKWGNAIYIPAGAVHALENLSSSETMKVLAISSPPYQDSDMFFIEDKR